MAKRCDLTDTGVQSGNNVSHSNRKTRRRFLPNLQRVTFESTLLKKTFSLKVTAATLRSIDHNGGFDNFLLTTNTNKLSEAAKKIRRQLKKIAETDTKGEAKKPVKKKPAARKTAPKKDSKTSAA